MSGDEAGRTRSLPPEGSPFAGLILAAGRSSRMEGGSKLVAAFDGETVLGRVATIAAAAGLDPILVAASGPGADIRTALEGRDVRFVVVRAAQEGRLASVLEGLDALQRLRVPGVAILLGDEPGLRQDHVRAVVDGVRSGSAVAGRAGYEDRPGHPVVLKAAALGTIRGLASGAPPEASLWAIVAGSDLPCTTVRIDRNAPIDVDTREALDLARLRSGNE